MLVSVVIPVYNSLEFLDQCLQSVINQTYKRIEIIIVDDCSTDGSWEWLQEFALKNSETLIKLKQQPENVSWSKGREVGYSLSTGDVIMFLDSDDWLELNAIERCITIMNEQGVDVVSFGSYKNYPNKEIPLYNPGGDKLYDKSDLFKLQANLFGLDKEELAFPHFYDRYTPMYMRLIKRHLFIHGELPFIDTKWMQPGEDLLFNLQLMEVAKSWYHLNVPLYHYRKKVLTSATNKHNAEYLKKWFIHFDLMREWAKKTGKDENYARRLKNRAGLEFIGLLLKETNAVNTQPISVKKKNILWVLKETEIGDGINQLPTEYMPIHWRFFFFLAKNKYINLLLLTSSIMRFLMSRREY